MTKTVCRGVHSAIQVRKIKTLIIQRMSGHHVVFQDMKVKQYVSSHGSYSRSSMARTLIARLPRLFRTLS